MKEKISVIGSINTDLVVQTRTFPKPGETIIGGNFNTFPGGKGANQAVAASRLGADVNLISKIGKDDFGKKAIEGFLKDNIRVEYVFQTAESKTGVAIIIIDTHGQNSIVVSPGANSKLTPSDIDHAISAIKNASIVLVQLEIPLATVEYAIKLADKLGKKVVLNPAPASTLQKELYEGLYLITPNETEAAILTGIEVVDSKTASKAAAVLLDKGTENVIITLGDKGAFFKNKAEEFLIPAQKVNIVDTTAAGDTFNGAIAIALAQGKTWREALTFANKASAIAVSRLGAQTSVPYLHELDL